MIQVESEERVGMDIGIRSERMSEKADAVRQRCYQGFLRREDVLVKEMRRKQKSAQMRR